MLYRRSMLWGLKCARRSVVRLYLRSRAGVYPYYNARIKAVLIVSFHLHLMTGWVRSPLLSSGGEMPMTTQDGSSHATFEKRRRFTCENVLEMALQGHRGAQKVRLAIRARSAVPVSSPVTISH
ncbi:hypothetical protein BJX65DRAFT_140437 [Aspergillus insuetus]